MCAAILQVAGKSRKCGTAPELYFLLFCFLYKVPSFYGASNSMFKDNSRYYHIVLRQAAE